MRQDVYRYMHGTIWVSLTLFLKVVFNVQDKNETFSLETKSSTFFLKINKL